VPRSVSVILSLPPHFSLCGSSRSAAQQVWYGQLAAYSFKASYFNLLSYVVTIAFSVLHVTFYAAYSLFLFLFPCHWCATVMSSLVNAFDLVDPDCARLIPFAVRPFINYLRANHSMFANSRQCCLSTTDKDTMLICLHYFCLHQNGGVSDAVTSELGDRQSSHPVKNPASVLWQVLLARCCLPQSPGQPQHLKYQNRIWKKTMRLLLLHKVPTLCKQTTALSS